MSNEWGFGWDADAARSAGDVPGAAIIAVTLPPKQGRHRRSNSTPLENTSSELLTAASDTKAEEQDDYADGSSRNFLQDVLNGPTLTKTRSERVRSRGGARGSTRRGAMQSAARQHAALAQRVSGRMTKGRSKMTVMREGYSSDEEEDSGDDAYQQVPGRGGKVKRVLANRQSAQRSRIRKLQHISELEVTLEALQDDLFKLNPQLTKLEAKQAGLDDDNKELQQKLAALKVESRQKEAVNQALAQELSACRHKQHTEQLAHKQQQQQQQQQRDLGNFQKAHRHLNHAPSQMQAQASNSYQPPFGSPQPSYAPPMHMYPQMQPQTQGHAHQQPDGAQTDPGYDQDFVDRLMERYQYDQAQARHRQQQAAQQSRLAQQQQQQQQQNFQQSHHQQERQQQQQQPQCTGRSTQDRAHQQSHQSLDVLAELRQGSSCAHGKPTYQDSEDTHASAHWAARQEEYQQEPAARFAGQDHHSPQVSRQSSHDSREGDSSPQLIYSNGFPVGDAQYMLSQQGVTQLGQHSLDAEQSPWASHKRTSLQQQSTGSPHALAQSGPSNRVASQQQRHSFDGPYFQPEHPGQTADQSQLLYRSQSLTHPPQQAALPRQAAHDSTPQQQQSECQRPQSADGGSLSARDTARHPQRHRTGQTYLGASPFVLHHIHSQHSDAQHHMQCPSVWPYASTQSQTHSQSQSQYPASAQTSPWEGNEGLFQAGLPKKQSSGDMSRHGSGSTEVPLSEYVPAESILRSFDSVSNASSEQSERSLGATHRAALGGFLRAEGHGPIEAVRHAAWAKGMPPSGKKKKDNSQHRAALSRLT
ncbi:hypothetical protein ABBQ32_013229 [Trebouxia sp. C0010 RCD-2024]